MTGKSTRLDNHRVFRAEAVEAYATRRAGDAWIARWRGESWVVAALTAMAISGLILLVLGSR